MRNTCILTHLFLLFLFTTVSSVHSQTPDSLSSASGTKPVKIGLALSGGGARGFAHIGILKVFEEEGIPVHMITGTSMGAVIGSLYSIGYTPGEIKEVALQIDWRKLFDDNYRFNPQNFSNNLSDGDPYLFTFPFHNNKLRLPVALTHGQNVAMMLYRLTIPYHDVEDFSNLPVPFACVATNLATGEPQLLNRGYLPDAVRASFAIPTIFQPVKIDSQSYIDGSISRNIPAEDVRKMGADIVIASDVGKPIQPVDSLYSLVHILRQSVGFHLQESDQQQITIADYHIRPDIDRFFSFSYNNIEEIIREGEKAARKIIPVIRNRIHAAKQPVIRTISVNRNDTLLITGIRLNNLEERQARHVRRTLRISPPSRTTVSDLERRINRLYDTGLFNQVSYRLRSNPGQNDKILEMTFQHRKQDYAGFGLRYDSKYKAALLFGISLSDNLITNDRFTGRLRVGEVLEFSAGYSAPATLLPVSHYHMNLSIHRSSIDHFTDGDVLSAVEVKRLTLSPSFSFSLPGALQVQAGMEAEFYNLDETVGDNMPIPENTRFLLKGFGGLTYHTLNRPYFPTRGQKLDVHAVVSDRMWGSTENFFQLTGNWMGTIQLGPFLNIHNAVIAGYSSSVSIPLHYNYYLGGLTGHPGFPFHQFSFMGFEVQQLRSANMMAFQSQLQFGLSNDIYMTAGWNIAHLSDHWTFNLRENRLWDGFSISAGALTIAGPVELSLSTPDLRGGYTLKVDVGYHF